MRLRILTGLALPILLAVGCTDAYEPGPHAPEAPLMSSHTCELGVPLADAYAEIAALRDQIDALERSGALNAGQARALRNKLDNARRHLDGGRICPALAQLAAFREQVGNFVAGGVLSGAEAAPLLEGADRLIDGWPAIVEGTISAGGRHTCGLTGSGAAYCWGNNDSGELGDGTTTDRLLPTPVADGHTFIAISAGASTTCALKPDGTAWCWGSNNARLGDGTSENRAVPGPVSGGRQFTRISAGNHICALEIGGAAYCWGSNDFGQLGNGAPGYAFVPTPVVGGHTFAEISVSSSRSQNATCAVRGDGAAYCWGANLLGQLGDGTTTDSSEPVAVLGGHLFSSVSVGFWHACGLRSTDDAILCWGDDGSGQRGNGDGLTDYRALPTVVAGGHAFAALSAGEYFTCAIDDIGAAFCWGRNWSGQLGDGTTVLQRDEPVAVLGEHLFSFISSGPDHVCGRRATDGAALCWGLNVDGQLGDGTTTNGLVPTAVSGWNILP